MLLTSLESVFFFKLQERRCSENTTFVGVLKSSTFQFENPSSIFLEGQGKMAISKYLEDIS